MILVAHNIPIENKNNTNNSLDKKFNAYISIEILSIIKN